MTAIRLGAVAYLNAAPLVYGLERQSDRFALRFDVPATCASLLHDRQIDVGLIPSIEYLRRPDYLIVPDIAIASHGPVASVALFSSGPIDRIKSIALDTSSRTSAALLKILCQYRFRITPEFVPHRPDLDAMTYGYGAALLIGDPALDSPYAALGLRKIDLGEEWTNMTGLPFVYAAWTGRTGAVTDEEVHLLQKAQEEGTRAASTIAAEYGRGDADATARASAYLRDNVKYGLGPEEARGLQMFLDYASELGLASRRRTLEFF